MSLRIEVTGFEEAIARAQRQLEALGPKNAGRALARAINRALPPGKKEAAKIAKSLYTATGQVFGNVIFKKASASNLHGEADFQGDMGRSLIHFKPKPKTPHEKRPAAGVSVQIKKGGGRYVPRGRHGGSKPFIMKKAQGGFGVFSRYGNNKFEMLMGPSGVQALQRRDTQYQVEEKMADAFGRRLEHEIDVLFAGIAR